MNPKTKSKNAIDLSVVITSFNTAELLINCIDSILRHTSGIKYEIIIVDNASKDLSTKKVKKLSINNPIRLIVNKINVGFGMANNQGIKVASGSYILLLNSDTLINNNLLREMVEWMNENKAVGISTCALKNENGTVQGTGGYFPTLPRVFSWMTIQDLPFVDRFIKPFHPMKEKSLASGESFYSKEKELDWVTGAFLLARKNALVEADLFDKDYFMYMEEVDLCYKVKKAGWKVLYLPKWSITHYGGASGTKEFSVINEIKSLKLFYKKHYPSWQYPFMRLFLKIGTVLRVLLFGVLEGAESAKIYANAFKIA